MAFDEERVAALCGEIQRYLDQHPDAADSVEGIRRWWIARIRLEETAKYVQEALDRLVARGVVVKRIVPDGTAVYEIAGMPGRGNGGSATP
jgi:hypothetical protein